MVSFENRIDANINEKIIALHHLFLSSHFKGFVETVPAYSSLAVIYDVVIFKKHHPGISALEFIKSFAADLLATIEETEIKERLPVIIPVYYNGEDLEFIAEKNKLTSEDVIVIHTSKTYRVYMQGFLPGFAYMGSVDERIAIPRRSSPRINVPAGSVGIAGFQTGIYPLTSPGGWQLLGQTPIKIFDQHKANPCLLKAGDMIQFTSITKNEFDKLDEYSSH